MVGKGYHHHPSCSCTAGTLFQGSCSHSISHHLPPWCMSTDTENRPT